MISLFFFLFFFTMFNCLIIQVSLVVCLLSWRKAEAFDKPFLFRKLKDLRCVDVCVYERYLIALLMHLCAYLCIKNKHLINQIKVTWCFISLFNFSVSNIVQSSTLLFNLFNKMFTIWLIFSQFLYMAMTFFK